MGIHCRPRSGVASASVDSWVSISDSMENPMYAVLCDSNGKSGLGTDSVIWVDGRLRQGNLLRTVREYKARFRNNFPHKYEFWTHCYFIHAIRDMPDAYNEWKPKLYKI